MINEQFMKHDFIIQHSSHERKSGIIYINIISHILYSRTPKHLFAKLGKSN